MVDDVSGVKLNFTFRTSDKFPLKAGQESRAIVRITFANGKKSERLIDVLASENGNGTHVTIAEIGDNSRQALLERVKESGLDLDDKSQKDLIAKIHAKLTKELAS